MILHDLNLQFKASTHISEKFVALMRKSFKFYADFCNDFTLQLGDQVQSGRLKEYLQKELRHRFFDPAFCSSLEISKKRFLAENIKLEQFQENTNYATNFLNDLETLKKLSDKIYQLLQKHWEYYKYQQAAVNDKSIIEFIFEIKRIGIIWDNYLEKYITVSKILDIAGGKTKKKGFVNLEVKYHLPEEDICNIVILTGFVDFLKLSYEFVLKIHDVEEKNTSLNVLQLEVGNPLDCILSIPIFYSESFKKFLHYLSVDVLKRDTLLKFVMEIVRLQQGNQLSKTVITSYQKKLSKQLETLHPEGFLSVDEKRTADSVEIMTELCSTMEKLQIQHKDLLTGSIDKLARNRVFRTETIPVQNSKSIKSVPPSHEIKESGHSPNLVEKKQILAKDIKLDLQKKEHIGYLTR